jgi:quercetin dioxygenase-like cupin family protein
MEREPTARVMAGPAEVRAVPRDRGGALWRLAEPGRQLDANVIRVPPGGAVGAHIEPDLDVLLCVVAGSGVLEGAAGPEELEPGSVAWLPHGSRRSLAAGPEGLVYVTAHRRRPGLSIRPGPPPGADGGSGTDVPGAGTDATGGGAHGGAGPGPRGGAGGPAASAAARATAPEPPAAGTALPGAALPGTAGSPGTSGTPVPAGGGPGPSGAPAPPAATRTGPPAAGPEGGEPACALHRICPECDLPAEGITARHCVRCGATLPS